MIKVRGTLLADGVVESAVIIGCVPKPILLSGQKQLVERVPYIPTGAVRT